MKFILRIFSILTVLILGVYVLFSSFLSSKDIIDIPASYSDIYEPTLEKFNTMSGAIVVENPLPGVILQSSKQLSFSPSSLSGNTVSGLEENISFLSLYNTLEDFTLSGALYKADLISPGDIYIDARSESGNVFLYSLSSTLHIRLLGKNGDTYTQLTLFPHMYIEFNPGKAFLLKGADMLRVKNFYKLGYYDAKTQNEDQNYTLNRYLGDEKYYEIMSENIDFIKEASQKYFSQFEEIEVYNFPGKDILERYQQIFINATKKKELYKNAYFTYIIQTLQGKKSLQEALSKKEKYKKDLQVISPKDVEELENLEKNILYNLFPHTGIYTVPAKQIFASIVSSDTSRHYENKYPYFAYATFSNQSHITIKKDSDIYSQYKQYVDSLSLSKEQKKIYFQYFSFFIEQEISSIVSSSQTTGISIISRLLSHHLDLWNASYNHDNTSIKTGVYVYGVMLETIEKYMRENFFYPDRNSKGLLQVQKNAVNSSQIGYFEQSIESIYMIFQNNKGYLNLKDPRDEAINDKFIAAYQKIEEYLLALKNYQAYENEYDALKKNILNIDTISDSKVQDEWREEDIRNYFAQFEGGNILQANITKNKNIFQIENYRVYNSILSFTLNPQDDYKIYNLSINGSPKSYQYKLGIIEQNSKENESYQSLENGKERNAFSNFFMNLVSEKYKTVEIYSTENIKKSEDPAEIVFKKIKLLGARGEFSSIKNSLDIQYNNIGLERTSQGYDIFISNVPVKIGSENFLFSAQYVFSQTDHYFRNIVMKSQGKQLEFKVLGSIEITELSSQLGKVFQDITDIDTTSTILGNTIFAPINISYNPQSQKTTFKFVSSGEKYTIIQSGDMIEKFYKGTKNLLPQSISPSQIPSYLK